MDGLYGLTHLVERQSDASNGSSTVEQVCIACGTGNNYNGYLGARISSIFVILIGSTFGKSYGRPSTA
jgi:hypothetical protein